MSRVHSPDRRPAARSLLPAAFALAFTTTAFAANVSPPTISGTPSTQVQVNAPYSFKPAASDPDGNRLRFSIVNQPAWASFNRRTGALQGTPAAAGTFANVSISVSDGQYVARLPAFSIVVSASAPTTPIVAAPTIGGTPPTSARVGQAYSFTPTASDPAGLPLTFSVTNKPSWAAFSTSTGTLAGTPGAVDVSTFSNVTISVSNGTSSTSLAPFSIAVQQASLGSATLSWQPPTTRADGSPLTNLAGYRVYYGTQAGTYPNRVVVNSPGVSAYVVDNLPPGTYWFVVTAVDANGLESAQSASVSKAVG
jgi:hypothetical protein